MTVTKMKHMKTNTDTNLPDDLTLPAESAPAIPVRSARLKVLIVMTSVMAAWLSFQAVTEAIAVNRLLDRVQDAVSRPTLVKTPAEGGSNKIETKPRVAGL